MVKSGAVSRSARNGARHRRERQLSALVVSACAAVLAVMALAGCGGGGGEEATGATASEGENAVAIVEGSPISHETLRHWMLAMTGGDFFEVAGKPALAGLVSEPARYDTCVSDARELMGKRDAAIGTDARLIRKCRQLYSAIKQQALGFLISSRLKIGEAAVHKVVVTESEVASKLTALQRERFSQPGQFAEFLRERRWTPSDERYLVKLNLLSAGLQQVLQREIRGKSREELEMLTKETMTRWREKTTCRPGFVIPQCKEYAAAEAPKTEPSVAVLIEEITRHG